MTYKNKKFRTPTFASLLVLSPSLLVVYLNLIDLCKHGFLGSGPKSPKNIA